MPKTLATATVDRLLHPTSATDARSSVIYEWPNCETRYVDERRPDCQLFTRRIGPGGTCPHCLLTDAQADLF